MLTVFIQWIEDVASPRLFRTACLICRSIGLRNYGLLELLNRGSSGPTIRRELLLRTAELLDSVRNALANVAPADMFL